MRGHIDDCECTTLDAACHECRASYVWSDGSDMVYEGWSDELEPGLSDCVLLDDSGWKDEHCQRALQYVCQREPLTATTPTATLYVTSDAATTEESWQERNDTGFLYLYVQIRATFEDAKAHCQSYGAQLVSVTSQEEQDYLLSRLPNERSFRYKDHWIGLKRGSLSNCSCSDDVYDCKRCRNSWLWDDGTTMNYQDWRDSPTYEPGRESCARLNSLGWADMDCYYPLKYICEIYLDPNENTTTVAQSSTHTSPAGWMSMQGDDSSGETYYWSEVKANFSSAQSACAAMGANLASVTSLQQHLFLKAQISNATSSNVQDAGHWIGLKRGSQECSCTSLPDTSCSTCRKSFVWQDATKMTFTAGWELAYQPGLKSCVRLSYNGWTDTACATKLYYICKQAL